MTKMRQPDSIEDAVKQAAALLGNDAISTALCAIGLNASTSLIDKWSDMDAAQTPSLRQALAMENLLIKTGHAPIFSELFARLLPHMPAVPAASEDSDPLRAAMRATKASADLMDKVDVSMIDGRIDRAELNAIEKLTFDVQRHIARLRRAVRKRLGVAPRR